jgi:hypothetical protein
VNDFLKVFSWSHAGIGRPDNLGLRKNGRAFILVSRREAVLELMAESFHFFRILFGWFFISFGGQQSAACFSF